MSTDMQIILFLTATTCVVTGGIGAVVLRVVRHRSLLVSIIVAAVVPVAAVSAAVATNVNAMFISRHDSTVVTVALVLATGLAVVLSVVLGRRVTSGSQELRLALRGLAEAGPDQPASAGTTRASTPAELTHLAEELEATRVSLAHSRERERALERSRRELVAFMSHDLRTPLAGLRALAEGLEDGVVEDQTSALRQMRHTVERMNSLVGDLFELSRLTSDEGSPGPDRGPVSLLELAHDVVGEASELARRHRVELCLDTTDDADRLAVHGDADELARALGNLVGNAVRHTAPGGRVTVSARRGGDGSIRIAVSDGCGGIDAADMPRLFDVGWRADPERAGGDAGAGLGLAIAKGVVESHSGRISVDNVAGGCRFAVELPAQG
ncbi:MAG: sensor histidine kinase [Oryzihumus sp.]